MAVSFLRGDLPRAVDASEQVLHAQLLRVTMDHVPMVLWAIDRAGIFVFHDGKGLEGAGLSPGQHLGHNIFTLYPDDDGGVARALGGEVTHTINESHGVWWESWLIPLRDEDGAVCGVAGLTLDITRAKRAEDDLRAQLAVVERQQQVIRDLTTPIIEVWDRVLTLPMIGVLDSVRTAGVMDDLLAEIVRTQARYAILDLTGVEVVDTRVANHLIGLVRAIRLLGAEGIVAGIRPSVAQTIVALGLDLSSIITHANLKAALRFCIRQMAGRDGH